MRRSLYVCSVLLVLVPALTSSTAHALANRVFVSARSGNNANDCSNINTPCQTFAGAVAQLNPAGAAIVLDSGGYGPLTITQSVTIEAPPGVLAFIHPPTATDAVTVNATAAGATVVLRGLTIEGAGQTTGSGINVMAVANLHVESCVITGFAGTSGANGNGIYFHPLAVLGAGTLFVKDTIIRVNGAAGIHVSEPAGGVAASVEKCRLENNHWGLFSDTGAAATIRDSVVSGNSGSALYASGAELNAEGCLVSYNNEGLRVDAASTLRASNCTVTDNTLGLVGGGAGSLLSRSNNTVEGNGTDGSFTGAYSGK